MPYTSILNLTVLASEYSVGSPLRQISQREKNRQSLFDFDILNIC